MRTEQKIVLTSIIVIAAALVVVSVFAFAYAGSTTANLNNPNTSASGTNGNWMMGNGWNDMMNGMMGGYWGQPSPTAQPATTTPTQSTIFPFIGFAALIGAAIVGVGGAAYYFTSSRAISVSSLPTRSDAILRVQNTNTNQNQETPYATISKTLTAEESKVMSVLIAHNGKYLQKYIKSETGFSRLKIHRIVARLAERGIVAVEQSGNTNEVRLSNWLKPGNGNSLLHQKSEEDLKVLAF